MNVMIMVWITAMKALRSEDWDYSVSASRPSPIHELSLQLHGTNL